MIFRSAEIVQVPALFLYPHYADLLCAMTLMGRIASLAKRR
jgi:hypothetical protein